MLQGVICEHALYLQEVLQQFQSSQLEQYLTWIVFRCFIPSQAAPRPVQFTFRGMRMSVAVWDGRGV